MDDIQRFWTWKQSAMTIWVTYWLSYNQPRRNHCRDIQSSIFWWMDFQVTFWNLQAIGLISLGCCRSRIRLKIQVFFEHWIYRLKVVDVFDAGPESIQDRFNGIHLHSLFKIKIESPWIEYEMHLIGTPSRLAIQRSRFWFRTDAIFGKSMNAIAIQRRYLIASMTILLI